MRLSFHFIAMSFFLYIQSLFAACLPIWRAEKKTSFQFRKFIHSFANWIFVRVVFCMCLCYFNCHLWLVVFYFGSSMQLFHNYCLQVMKRVMRIVFSANKPHWQTNFAKTFFTICLASVDQKNILIWLKLQQIQTDKEKCFRFGFLCVCYNFILFHRISILLFFFFAIAIDAKYVCAIMKVTWMCKTFK